MDDLERRGNLHLIRRLTLPASFEAGRAELESNGSTEETMTYDHYRGPSPPPRLVAYSVSGWIEDDDGNREQLETERIVSDDAGSAAREYVRPRVGQIDLRRATGSPGGPGTFTGTTTLGPVGIVVRLAEKIGNEPTDGDGDPIVWIVPPECQGQIVEVAYSRSYDAHGYKRVTDHSTGSVTYYSAEFDSAGTYPLEWEPWNGSPYLPDGVEWKPVI
jgi:hypothetical protein